MQCGNLDEARHCYERVLSIAPNHHKSQANLGVLFYKQGDLEASLAVFSDAIASHPEDTELHFNASRTYRTLGRFDEAVMLAQKAVNLSPNYFDGWINLGVTQMALSRYEEAEKSYRSALRLKSQSPVAHHNLAQALLQLGRLEEGWAEFEWRWRTPEFKESENVRALPQWDGQPMRDGVLLIWAEQGIGDQILYSSMVPEIKAAAQKVILACSSRLVGLFARSFPFASVVSQPDLLNDKAMLASITAQISSGGLGQYLRPNLDCFEGHSSFLAVDPGQVEMVREKYDALFPGRRRIGVSWCSKNPRSGHAKSISLKALAPALKHTDVVLVDLQYGDTTSERNQFSSATGLQLYRLPGIEPLTDLDGFAAHVATMDLVITVSNTTAHVAGGLGVPCWTLLPAGEGLRWYWFLDRSDSPWYPSVRLFRQAIPGDWTLVVNQISQALDRILAT